MCPRRGRTTTSLVQWPATNWRRKGKEQKNPTDRVTAAVTKIHQRQSQQGAKITLEGSILGKGVTTIRRGRWCSHEQRVGEDSNRRPYPFLTWQPATTTTKLGLHMGQTACGRRCVKTNREGVTGQGFWWSSVNRVSTTIATRLSSNHPSWCHQSTNTTKMWNCKVMQQQPNMALRCRLGWSPPQYQAASIMASWNSN